MTPGVTHLPRAVDHDRAFGSGDVGAADRLDLAVDQEDRAIVDPPALAVEDGRAADQRSARRG